MSTKIHPSFQTRRYIAMAMARFWNSDGSFHYQFIYFKVNRTKFMKKAQQIRNKQDKQPETNIE